MGEYSIKAKATFFVEADSLKEAIEELKGGSWFDVNCDEMVTLEDTQKEQNKLPDRLMHFKFNENQLIQYLTDFLKDHTNSPVDEEERSYIAEFVMNKKDNFYEVEK